MELKDFTLYLLDIDDAIIGRIEYGESIMPVEKTGKVVRWKVEQNGKLLTSGRINDGSTNIDNVNVQYCNTIHWTSLKITDNRV